jgi:hypothetical protein
LDAVVNHSEGLAAVGFPSEPRRRTNLARKIITTYNILRQFITNRGYAPEELYQEVVPVWNCYLPGYRVSMTLRVTTAAEVDQPNVLSIALNRSNLDLTTTTTQLGEINAIFGLLGVISIIYEVLGIFQIL